MNALRNRGVTDELRTFDGSKSGIAGIGKSTLIPSLPMAQPTGAFVQPHTGDRRDDAATDAPDQATGAPMASLFGQQTSGPGSSVSASQVGSPRTQSATPVPGALLPTRSARETRVEDVARIEHIYQTAHETGTGVLGTLVPAYIAARDQCDPTAVAEIGGRILGAYSLAHGAKSALDEALRKAPHQSVPGTDIAEELALAQKQQAIEAKAPLLPPLITVLDTVIARTLTPHVFRGKEVAGQTVIVVVDGSPLQRTEKLTGELQRTIGMLVLVDEIKTQLGDQNGINRTNLQSARSKLVPWASRPLDIAFLRAALGVLWDLLDATVDSPLDTKPSAALNDASKQAAHTGWLGDVGEFDINVACTELRIGRRENVEFVIRQLYTADPDTRARLLIQIRERGLLDALGSGVGWADIKELHDSLGSGFSEIKSDLQRYFIGKRGYGPGVGHEWEHHDSSLHGLVGRLGSAGAVFNFALDVGTFGFNSSYGKALDDRSEGRTSESEASRAKMHAVGRTAAIAALSLVTGGLADKVVRGGAATVSTLRAVGAGAAGGSVGGVTALGTSDVYGNYVSGDQQGFSSPEEYVKAALLGGAIGGAVAGVTNGISGRVARRYLPEADSDALRTSSIAAVATDSAPAGAARPAGHNETAHQTPPATPEAVRGPAGNQDPVPIAPTRELGLRAEVMRALESLENIKADPVGDINSQPNHNHYSAAQREAAGEVVARRPNGRPFSHIGDLQRAYDGLNNVKETLEREIGHLPDTITERGLDVLVKRYSEVQRLMNRLAGFLNEIGHGRFPPYHAFPPGT